MALHATEKVQRYRSRMATQGMRQINIWVPDVRSPRVLEEARNQSIRASQHPVSGEEQLMEALETSMAEDKGWAW